MLVLLHALIPCLAAYILPSSPVLLHIYCTCFSTFWHCHPYILQYFNVFTPWFLLYTRLQIQCSLRVCEPHPFCCSWSCKTHVSNNKEMAFTYTEVLVYRSFTCPTKIPLVKGTAHENKKQQEKRANRSHY